MKIPLYKPYIGNEEISAVMRVLQSKKLTRGQETEEFEKEFAKYSKKKYAIAINSGTSGLHILVRTMGWKEGDEIITTPFSYIASANALLFEKITPVFVDIDISTLNIDIKKIEEKITPKTKGILLVHILGLPADVTALKKIKEKYNLQIIEDACESIGVIGDDFKVSQIGEASVYGFHENKQMTTFGEGGMIVTDNNDFAQKCRSMRDQGRSLKKDWINNVTLGFNFRMTEVQSAFGREQLKRINDFLEKRERLSEKYASLLSDIKGITTPQQMTPLRRSWFLYFVVFEKKEIRDYVHKELEVVGINSSINYFPPIYNFPMYVKCKKDCVNAEKISDTLLALPMYFEMNDIEVEEIVKVIKNSLIKFI